MFPVENLTCCTSTAREVDSAIKNLFDASQGPYWDFHRDHLDLDWLSARHASSSPHKLKYIVWAPKTHPTKAAIVTNRQDGGDTIIYNLSRCFKMELIKVCLSSENSRYPYYNFEYFNVGEQKRRVYVMLDDDKWVFFQSGNSLPFEASYKSRRIRDRLGSARILEYGKALGWDVQEEAFWNCSGKAFYGEQLKFLSSLG